MKFKTRLVVAFFTIILIPLALSSALVCMVGKYQLSSIEKNYRDQEYDGRESG